MNNIKLSGKVVGINKFVKNLDLLEFRLRTEEVCKNHKTGGTYLRQETHKVVVWGKDSHKVKEALENKLWSYPQGVEVLVEGSLRKRAKRSWVTWSGDMQLPTSDVSIEALSVKVPAKIKKKVQYRDVITGKF